MRFSCSHGLTFCELEGSRSAPHIASIMLDLLNNRLVLSDFDLGGLYPVLQSKPCKEAVEQLAKYGRSGAPIPPASL